MRVSSVLSLEACNIALAYHRPQAALVRTRAYYSATCHTPFLTRFYSRTPPERKYGITWTLVPRVSGFLPAVREPGFRKASGANLRKLIT